MGREIILTSSLTRENGTLPLFVPGLGSQDTCKLYIYPSRVTTKHANDDTQPFIFYTTYSVQSSGSMSLVPYSGHSSIDAKFMSANTNKWTIAGYVYQDTGATHDANEVVNIALMRQLLQINKEKFTVGMTICGEEMLGANGGVIGSIVADPFGQGTGLRWPFTMEITELGK